MHTLLGDRAAVVRVLGREPRWLEMSKVRQFAAVRRFLVTGAGGSLGAELCRQLVAMNCGRLWALDHSDHALLNLVGYQRSPGTPVKEVLCDVRDQARLSIAFQSTRPAVVIHGAALKHVHMGDRHPAESVLTNLIGVRNAFEAALESGAESFVFVSSDKAAAPSSVMGACKRLAELYLEHRRRELAGSRMRVLSVRFGNVFGSQGSVAEVFARQIAAGGPLTVTHRDMRRFFMTIEEAVQLILLVACGTAESDDADGAYLLDMGQPVRIVDIAERMMAEAGVSLPIITCGAREGEKIEEELYDEHETVAHSGIAGVLRVSAAPSVRPLSTAALEDLERAAKTAGDDYVRLRVFSTLSECLGTDLALVS